MQSGWSGVLTGVDSVVCVQLMFQTKLLRAVLALIGFISSVVSSALWFMRCDISSSTEPTSCAGFACENNQIKEKEREKKNRSKCEYWPEVFTKYVLHFIRPCSSHLGCQRDGVQQYYKWMHYCDYLCFSFSHVIDGSWKRTVTPAYCINMAEFIVELQQ